MKITSAPLRALLARAVRVVGFIFGQVTWSAPPWWGSALNRCRPAGRFLVRRRRPIGIFFAAILALSLGSWWASKWWQAHRPRELVYQPVQQVAVSYHPPAVQTRGAAEKDLSPVPLVVRFSIPAAPLDRVGKEPGPGVTLKPALPGAWRWSDSRTLTFTPEAKHWAAGARYHVELPAAELMTGMEYDRHELDFTTPPLDGDWREVDFYTSPEDPSIHQVVGELRLSHPADIDEVARHVKMDILGNTPLFVPAPSNTPPFTVTAGNGPRQYFFRSRNLSIPQHEDFIRFSLEPKLTAATGGAPLDHGAEAKARVPDRFSGFSLTGAQATIIRTDEGEPQQILFITSDHALDSAQVASRTKVWWRENGWDMDDKAKLEKQLSTAKPIALTPVESEAPLTQQHGFRFVEPRPGTLLVRVEPGVQAPGGFEMNRRFQTYAEVPLFPKETRLLGKGNILALGGSRRLLAESRGIANLQVTFGRVPVSQIQHLITQNRWGTFSEPDLSERGLGEDGLTQCWRKVLTLPLRNEWDAVQSEIDLSQAPPMVAPDRLPGGRGIFFVHLDPVQKVTPPEVDTSVQGRVEDPDDDEWQEDRPSSTRGYAEGWEEADGETSQRFIMITDLGLLIKSAADGTRDVFVMSLSSGKPIEGVALKALAQNGVVLETATTDASGRARLPVLEGNAERQPVAVLAEKGDDVTYLPLKERQLPAMDFSRFDVEGVLASRQKAVEGFLFTERGIYRPGDPVHVGALVRRRDWQPVLEGLPVRVTMSDSQGRLVASEMIRLSYDGFFEVNFQLPEGAPLGKYELAADVMRSPNDIRFRLGRTPIRVEEFQPDRMKVNATVDPTPPAGWMPAAAAIAKVEVASLFGDAAAERRVTMRLELSPTGFSFPEWEGFTFYDRAATGSRSRAGRTIDLGEMKTDEHGIAEFKLPLETVTDASYQLAILSEAFEREGGRSVRHAMTRLVSPWEQVLGWKADGDLDYLAKDATRLIHLVAIDRSLKPVALEALRRRVIEIRNVAVLTKLENGNHAYVSTPRERILGEENLDLSAGGLDLTLATDKAGSFRIEIVDVANTVLCAIPYHVAGRGDASGSLDREAELKLTLDRGQAMPGEEIEVSLSAPYAGAGIVTLERDRVLAHQWFRTESHETTVRLRIPADIDGTVYVSAAFLRSPDSPEIFHSPLSYAAEPLRIEPVHRRFAITLEAPKEIRPGTQAKVTVSSSQASRLVLYAVDEGIHRITSYQLPRPLDYFTRKQALETRTLQWLDLLLPDYRLLKAAPAFGGDADSALSMHLNPFKRRQEAPVVFWSGIVEAGPQPREISWPVPDYFNGNLRIMAVAANAGAVGVAETQTLVKAPIILVPNAPLFVAPGDEFEASLAVTNHLAAPGTSRVELQAAADDSLELIGESRQAIELEPNKEGLLRFRFRARDQLGAAELKFTATGGGETILRSLPLSVRPASHHLTRVVSGWFRTGSHEVKTPRQLYPQFRRTEATASVLPLGLARGLEAYVDGFPHGCSEQITSRAMVKLLVSTESDFGLSPALAAEHLRGAIAQLANRQQSDGGFGYWSSGAPRPLEFHSLYVLHFLTEARLLGQTVPEEMMNGAIAYAENSARSTPRSGDEADLIAYAVYLLARNGQTPSAQLLNLRDTLTKRFGGSWEQTGTAAWIAGTYRLMKQDNEAEMVMKACLKPRDKAHTPSSLRYDRTAQAEDLKIFYIRCRHFPEQAKRFGYEDLEPVMAPLRDESFTTLTSAFMTLALKAYGDAAANADVQLSLLAVPAAGGAGSALAGPVRSFVRASFPAGTSAISFRRDQRGGGDTGAFFQTVEQGFDTTPPAAETSGLGVFRELTPVKAGSPVRPGDAIQVKLIVRNLTAKPLNSLAVVDLLPAGFEVVADDLKSGAGTVPGANFAELREDRSLFYLDLAPNGEWSVSYRIKAVCPGSFTVPPALVEDMYDRGRHGISAAGRLEIQPATP